MAGLKERGDQRFEMRAWRGSIREGMLDICMTSAGWRVLPRIEVGKRVMRRRPVSAVETKRCFEARMSIGKRKGFMITIGII